MRHAFTIVEIIVTICILGVLSAIAMPSAGKLLDRVHVRGAVLEIESLFSGARHIAIARSAQTTVEIEPQSALFRFTRRVRHRRPVRHRITS